VSTPLPIDQNQLAGLRIVRDAIQKLLSSGHGKTEYTVAPDGELLPLDRVETDRMKDGESLEGFLARVWTTYKIAPGKSSIGFSVHDGRLTARITTRQTTDDDRLAELAEQISRLSAQLGAIGAYIEQSRAGAPVVLDGAEFTNVVNG
jgi:hypothetical protein